MARLSTFRARRRSAAEIHALLPLQRRISSIDPLSRRKYVREFVKAFETYERVISRESLIAFCGEADTLLVSDFHALDACQFFVCELLEELSVAGRPLALLLEAIFTRDQHILDEWQAQSISDDELRHRLRFETEWGYEWEPFLHTLKIARSLHIPIHGADCAPRGNMRRIVERDIHAADTLARIRKKYPDALLLVFFGESHLAPNHLPQQARQKLGRECVRTVLQNVDALYFRSAGEAHERVTALRVNQDTAAVFNATPVEKWQSYRLCISRWQEEPRKSPDFTPIVYDLIDALLAFLHIERYADDDFGSRYLVDCYPEVANVASVMRAKALLARRGLPQTRHAAALAHLVERGSCYIPELNLYMVQRLRMEAATLDVACFVHHACRNFQEVPTAEHGQEYSEEAIYVRALDQALIQFGARILYPSHLLNDEQDFFAKYSVPKEEIEATMLLSYRQYMRMLDSVMLHRDYELYANRYAAKPTLLQDFLNGPVRPWPLFADLLGELLGIDLYRAYLAGKVSRGTVRSLYFRKLRNGNAREIYFSLARRVRERRPVKRAA